MRCWSPAPRSACSGGSARPSIWSAPKGAISGLRVFLGSRSAIVSSTAVDPAGFAQLAERAVAMARVVPEDPYGGLAAEAAARRRRPRSSSPIRPSRTPRRCLPAPPRPRRRRWRCTASPTRKARTRAIGRDRDRARHLGRVRRPLCAHQPLRLGDRAGRRGHRDAARLRLFQRRASRPISRTRPRSAIAPASGRWRG